MDVKRPRLVPCLFHPDYWDIEGMESWLTAQAAKGRYLRECGKYCLYFEKGMPQAVRYRLDAISPLSPIPNRERATRNEEMGWEFIDYVQDFSIYLCTDPSAPELHTDPETQSCTMDRLAKRMRLSFICSCTALLLILCYFVNISVQGSPIILDMVNHYLITYLPLFTSFPLLISEMFRCIRLLNLHRRLCAGLPVDHAANYRRKLWGNGIMLAWLLLVSVIFLAVTLSIMLTPANASKNTASPLAFGLEEIEPDTVFPAPFDSNFNNRVYTTRWALPSTIHYEIMQHGTIPGRTWPNGTPYDPTLCTEYYKLLSPALAKRLMDAMVHEYSSASDHMEELSYPGLEQAVLAADEGGIYSKLFVRRGKLVVYLNYTGTANLEDCLPQLAQALP